MILSFTLVFVALAVLLLLLYLEGGHNASIQRLDDLAGCTRPVDLNAFRNLMDPKEEDFLRSNLLPRDFRAIQRERAISAIDYILNAMHNAAVLLRLGEAATRSSNQSIALAGRRLAENAIRLRAYGTAHCGQAGFEDFATRSAVVQRPSGRHLSGSERSGGSACLDSISHPGSSPLHFALKITEASRLVLKT
jgi:hypothetical protein